MKTAIIGGTFNPVHYGHLNIADEAVISGGYEKVIFIPTNIPSHKDREQVVLGHHRLAMTQIAVSPIAEFLVSDCDLRRGGISYTMDTIQDIFREHNISGKPGLIIGDDLADNFDTWKEWKTLVEMADLVVARRKYTENRPYPFKHRYLDNMILSVSSSDIRHRFKKGKAVRFMLPNDVYQYIFNHKLYG